MSAVLLAAGGGIGNVVMATPAAAALAEMGFQVSVYLPPKSAEAAELLHGWSAVGSVVAVPPPPPAGFDLVVHTIWSRLPVGRPGARGIHPEERFPGDVDLRTVHEAEANMIPVRELGYSGALPPAHVESGSSPPGLDPGTYWALAPGCKQELFWERKRWGGWEELARRLGGVSVFLGAKGESRPWMTGPGRLDLAGRTTLREATSWIAHSRAFVGIDCGLAHVAAALGVSTVVLFGATSEVKNRPLGPRVSVLTRDLPCRPCQMTPRWDGCVKWRCMGFSVEEVASAAHAAART